MFKILLLAAAAAGVTAAAKAAVEGSKKQPVAVVPVRAAEEADPYREPTAEEYGMDYMYI